MQHLDKLILNPVQAFKEWLEALEDSSIVGKRSNCDACPIVVWLKSKGFKNVTVYSIASGSYASINKSIYQLPLDLQGFISSIDRCTDLTTSDITKEIAIHCLNFALGKN